MCDKRILFLFVDFIPDRVAAPPCYSRSKSRQPSRERTSPYLTRWRLQKFWKVAVSSARAAMNFGRSNAYISDQRVLSIGEIVPVDATITTLN